MFDMKGHIKERKLDFVRRRRWHCKLVRDKRDDLPTTMPPVLQLDMKVIDSKKHWISFINL